MYFVTNYRAARTYRVAPITTIPHQVEKISVVGTPTLDYCGVTVLVCVVFWNQELL